MIATSSAVVERTVRPSVGAAAPRARLHRAEGAEEDVADRAVHRPAHQQRQQRARRADERAADDEHVVVQHEAGRRGGEAGERVQQRDHDRHVGAADREDEEDAEDERRDDQRDDEHVTAPRPATIAPAECERDEQHAPFTNCWPG